MQAELAFQLFPELSLNRATPWSCAYQGIEYPGEVILADEWRPDMGDALDLSRHFRLVILLRPQPLRIRDLRDPRIVVMAPRGPVAPSTQGSVSNGADSSLRRLRDAQAPYLTRPAEDTQENFSSQALNAYASGTLKCKSPVPVDLKDVWQELDNQVRFNRIASSILRQSYVLTPIDARSFPRALVESDVGHLFQGFWGPRGPEDQERLDSFSAGLGLAVPSEKRTFDPRDCRLFKFIEQRLETEGGVVPASSLCASLIQNYGLTIALVSLYLLAFVRHGKPATRLALKPQHQLALKSGGLWEGAAVTSEVIPLLEWRPDLALSFETLAYDDVTLWERASDYVTLLEGGLAPVHDSQDAESQWQKLYGRVGAICSHLGPLRRGLRRMEKALGTPIETGNWAVVKRLSDGLQGSSIASLYVSLRHGYPSPESLKNDLDRYRRLSQLEAMAQEAAGMKRYLDMAELSQEHQDLALDRLALLEQLNPNSLIANPSLVVSVKSFFGAFRSRYAAAYASAHKAHHETVSLLHRRLRQANMSLGALLRLNSIRELGDPVEPSLEEQYGRLAGLLKPCPANETELRLQDAPSCGRCGFTMASASPTREVAVVLGGLEEALAVQHRRLNSVMAKMILAQEVTARIDQFLKILQSADLSSLVAALDDDVVAFLRKMLGEVRLSLSLGNLANSLREKYPELLENDIPQFSQELGALIMEAFQEAKGKSPGKVIKAVFKD